MSDRTLKGAILHREPPTVTTSTSSEVIALNHLSIPLTVFERATFIQGVPGMGKTYLMKQMADVIIPTARKNRDNVFIFAAKDDLIERYYQPGDIVISIHSKDPSAGWNCMKELSFSSDPYITLLDIADVLFFDQRSQLQPFYYLAPQDIFVRSVMHLYEFSKKNNVAFDNHDLKYFFESTTVQGREGSPGYLDYAKRYPVFAPLLDYLGNPRSDMTLGLLSELRLMVSRTFIGGFVMEGGIFSAIETVRTGGHCVYLKYDYTSGQHASKRILSVILSLTLKESSGRFNGHNNWFLIDEFGLLPRLEDNLLANAIAFGREYGLRLICATQSAAQLRTAYKDEMEAATLLSLFPNVISFRVNDPFSRSIVTGRYGDARIACSYLTHDHKPETVTLSEPVIHDSDFTRLGKGDAIICMPELSNDPFIYHGIS